MIDYRRLAQDIKCWARELGFQQAGIADTELTEAESHLQGWLKAGYHGEMSYMARHGQKRTRPAALLPHTRSVISVRMDYLPSGKDPPEVLADGERGYIARYALGRDYHKLLKSRLRRLARRIEETVGPFGHRAFVDSAPVMEKPLAQKAGLGWQGKHTNLIHEKAGSWFFLGEIYTDLPLPPDSPTPNRCGTCTRCMDLCPTGAIIAPYQLDARRCIAYLTIEYKGSIPHPLRPLMGNRIFGCDDCQLVCPWNRFARHTQEKDFLPRHDLDAPRLVELLRWSERDFLTRTEGMALRRVGYICWLRNIAVALGNAPFSQAIIEALKEREDHPSSLVREHVAWARQEQERKAKGHPWEYSQGRNGLNFESGCTTKGEVPP